MIELSSLVNFHFYFTVLTAALCEDFIAFKIDLSAFFWNHQLYAMYARISTHSIYEPKI
jgi:hypothetical protein